jgi:hypothetical protein
MMPDNKENVPAGRALYEDLLAQYTYLVNSADSEASRAARVFADSQKQDDRALYLAARARLQTAEQAKEIFTRRGGEVMRLVARPE